MSLFRNEPFLTGFFVPNMGGHPAAQSAPNTHEHHHHHYSVETEEAVTLRVDVPGVSAKNLQVQVDDNVLRIRGERTVAGSESKFYRSFSIDPKIVDVDNIKAFLDCGVLTLVAPKMTEPQVSKTITVTEAPMEETQLKVASEGSE